MRRLAALTLAAGLCIAPLALATAAESEPRSISLSAIGTVKTRPDTALISTGVASEAPTAREALTQNTAAMSKVVAALKEQGIAPNDIQTADFSVHPRFHHPRDGAPAQISGYRVVNSVRIKVRDTTKLGAILDQVVTLGSNEIGGIQFTVENPAALEDEARRRAMATALKKAELLAKAAGAEIGQVLKITEEMHQPPRPLMQRMALEAKAADVPIEAGEHTVQVQVNVTWELN